MSRPITRLGSIPHSGPPSMQRVAILQVPCTNPLPGMRSSRSGVGLIELLVVMAIVTVALGEMVNGLVRVAQLAPNNEESARAHEALVGVVEQMRSVEFEELVATYNDDALDDPEGPGTAAGMHFAVRGLKLWEGDVDGRAGRIETAWTGLELREDTDRPELGLPRDLNSDGVVDALDHAADCAIFPVRAVVEWRSGGRQRSATLSTVLVAKIDPDATEESGF